MSRPGGQLTGYITDASTTVGTSSAQVLAAGNQRGYLCVFNPSATATIAFAPTPTVPVVGSVGIQLGPGQSIVFDGPKIANAFNAIASAAGNIGIWTG